MAPYSNKQRRILYLIENAALPPGHAAPFYIFLTQDSAHCMETDKEDLMSLCFHETPAMPDLREKAAMSRIS